MINNIHLPKDLQSKNPDFGPYLIIILKEMCRRVGANFYSIDFKKANWFWDYSWTEADETSFKKWMVDYLNSSRKARLEMGINWKNKREIKETVKWFVWDHGWKVL